MAKQGKFSPRGLGQIKKVAIYETTDEQQFATFKEANQHQAVLDLGVRARKFVVSEMADYSEEEQDCIIAGIVGWEEHKALVLKARAYAKKGG